MDTKEIIDISVPYLKMQGTYFLIDQGEIVYIGQSRNVFSRLNVHRPGRFKMNFPFDSVSIIQVAHPDDLVSLEDYFILKFRPRHNKKTSAGLLPL